MRRRIVYKDDRKWIIVDQSWTKNACFSIKRIVPVTTFSFISSKEAEGNSLIEEYFIKRDIQFE